jgi:hypothetical protein
MQLNHNVNNEVLPDRMLGKYYIQVNTVRCSDFLVQFVIDLNTV